MVDRDLKGQVWTFLVAGIILLGATYAALKPAPAPQLDPAMIPLVSGEEPVDLLFIKAGCPVCHTIPGIRGADGRVGPKLVLGTTGPQRLADPRYRGRARTVRDYIAESVLEPGAYVVEGYPDQAMPRWYGQKLSAAALEKMAGYLETLTGNP
jgi:mono/diheme cytochrome c family protein